MTLVIAQDYGASNGRLLNDELERFWKESAVAKFEVLSRHLTGGNKETHDLQNKNQ